MSDQIRAIPVAPKFGIRSSDDGKIGFIRMEQTNGQELTIAIPSAGLAGLIETIAALQSECGKNMGLPANSGQPILTEWLEVGGTPDGRVVISFQMKNKAMLRFVMEASMAQFLQTVLAARLGEMSNLSQTPRTRPN